MRTDLSVLLGLVAFALLTMPLYARSPSRERYARESERRGSFVLGSFVREWFYWFVRPVQRAAVALNVSPTAFTVTGVLLGGGAGVAFGTGHLVLGGWGVLLGGIADILDGLVARARGLASRRGAFLDSTLDRFAEVGAFVGLAVYYRGSAVAVAVVAAGLGFSLLVSYARARGESVDVLCKKGVMQRAERLLSVGFGALLDPAITAWAGWSEGTLLLAVLVIVAIGTFATAVYRTVWIARELPLRDTPEGSVPDRDGA